MSCPVSPAAEGDLRCTPPQSRTNTPAAGKKFWSTKDPGQTTFSFKIGMRQVILGWDEGVMTMKVGETATFIMSPEYGYGAAGFPAWGIPKNAHLQFDIELLSAE